MYRSALILLSAFALSLAACDPSKDEPPPDVEDTIFDEQVRALDRGRSVEDIQDEHMKKLKKSVDASDGSDTRGN
jgi:hypothetical protein